MTYGTGAASTDANSALSMGVPGVVTGVVKGAGAHTREEWIDSTSLPTGAKVAGRIIGKYFKEF